MVERLNPCTELHKGEQKDRTKTLAEFPTNIQYQIGFYGILWDRKSNYSNLSILFGGILCDI